MLASSEKFAPAYFDNRPLTHVASQVPAPPDRPYRLGEGTREVAETAPAIVQAQSTTELAASARPRMAEAVTRAPLSAPLSAPLAAPEEPAVSPVSAYAPARYDGGRAGFMSGRGLY
jgi:hypothetical protein